MPRPRKPARRVKEARKVPKTFRLSPTKIRAAQRALGASTATETIETALDMVVFRESLIAGTRAMRGVDILSSDE
jgi:hypothetical protein